MAQYDVYSGRAGGLFLDVQSDLLDGLSTRILVPLLQTNSDPQRVPRLHPTLTIDGQEYFMATNFLAAVEKSSLGKSEAKLMSRHDDISRAVYMLFQGF